jgi:hypothetical protein
MSLTVEEKDRLFRKLDHIENRVEKVERGMYGDTDNGFPGVIKDMGELKKFKSSLTKVGTSISAVVSLIVSGLITWFKS